MSSTVGKGSTFSITVDTEPLDGMKLLECSSELTRETKVKSVENLNAIQLNYRILLAEDTPFNQKIISKMLNKVGAEVIVADNGQIAVEKALAAQEAGQPFDVVLMDIQMPVMNGYEAARKIRDAGYDGQIVALAAHSMKDEIDECLSAGCDPYLSNPIDRATFLTEVASQMGQRSD